MKVEGPYKRYFSPVAEEAPVLKILYWVSAPLADGLQRLGFSASALTTVSNLFCLAALYAIWIGSPVGYAVCVFLGLIFDLCDGMVARMTKTSSIFGGFYDHYSDKVKIILLYLFLGLHYQNDLVWILGVLNIGFFLLAGSTNEGQSNKIMAAYINRPDLFDAPGLGQGTPSAPKRSPLRRLLKPIYFSLVVIYGNFMLYFIPMGFGVFWAQAFMGITLLVILRANWIALRDIHRLHHVLHENKVSLAFKHGLKKR